MSVRYALFLYVLSINTSITTFSISADASYTNRIARPNHVSLGLPRVAITVALLAEATVAALVAAPADMAQLAVQAVARVAAVKYMSPTFVSMHSTSTPRSTLY